MQRTHAMSWIALVICLLLTLLLTGCIVAFFVVLSPLFEQPTPMSDSEYWEQGYLLLLGTGALFFAFFLGLPIVFVCMCVSLVLSILGHRERPTVIAKIVITLALCSVAVLAPAAWCWVRLGL